MTVLLLGALATAPPAISQGQVVLLLIGAAAVWALFYGGACWLWPFARCWWCKGSGRRYQSEKRKTWRPCRWCKGSGRRLRIGRWIYNYVRGKQRGAM